MCNWRALEVQNGKERKNRVGTQKSQVDLGKGERDGAIIEKLKLKGRAESNLGVETHPKEFALYIQKIMTLISRRFS